MLAAGRPGVRDGGKAVDRRADAGDPDPRRLQAEARRRDEEGADAEPSERAALPDEAQQAPRPGGLDPRGGKDMRVAKHAVDDRRDDAETARRPHRQVTHGGLRVVPSRRAVCFFLSGFTNFNDVPSSGTAMLAKPQEYRTRGVMNLSVYRREGEPGLCCAVPADEPLPAFVGGGPWRRDAALLDPHALPQGFDPRAAGEALRSMGFYMFHGVVEPDPGSARQGRDGG